jgi:uncharacterized protein (TIGR02231 family)
VTNAETIDSGGINAPITGVTVFRDGARVTRVGTVTVQQGLRPVTVAALPDVADPASVRVAARGQGLGLLNVEVQRRFAADPRREDTARLLADVERWRDAVQALADEDIAEQAGLDFIEHLSDAAATSLARAVGGGRAGYDELSQMAGHLSASTANALGRRREIRARKLAADKELSAAELRLATAEKRSRSAVSYAEVSVTLEAATATEAEIELSYHVSGASWRPLYDLALIDDRLTVSYLAEITQQTGEDWPEIPLALSTTRRGSSQTLPELAPWYISRAHAVPMRAARSRGWVAAGGPAAQPMVAGAMAMPAMPMQADMMQEAEVLTATQGDGESGAGLTFTVARPLAVPADGGPHKTSVAKFDADATLDYLSVPVIAEEAYLRATVTNGNLLLLPGQARIFHGNRFVGETRLDTVAAGEEFEVQLGVDDQVKVERKLTRRSTSKAVLGGTRTIDIGYEITVENHRQGQAKVSVHDHIPLSTDGEIKVKSRETTPAPAETDDLGELTWNLTLDPGKSATIRHRFTVEHPAQVTVVGL